MSVSYFSIDRTSLSHLTPLLKYYFLSLSLSPCHSPSLGDWLQFLFDCFSSTGTNISIMNISHLFLFLFLIVSSINADEHNHKVKIISSRRNQTISLSFISSTKMEVKLSYGWTPSVHIIIDKKHTIIFPFHFVEERKKTFRIIMKLWERIFSV